VPVVAPCYPTETLVILLQATCTRSGLLSDGRTCWPLQRDVQQFCSRIALWGLLRSQGMISAACIPALRVCKKHPSWGGDVSRIIDLDASPYDKHKIQRMKSVLQMSASSHALVKRNARRYSRDERTCLKICSLMQSAVTSFLDSLRLIHSLFALDPSFAADSEMNWYLQAGTGAVEDEDM
jgi:hypothetical protein